MRSGTTRGVPRENIRISRPTGHALALFWMTPVDHRCILDEKSHDYGRTDHTVCDIPESDHCYPVLSCGCVYAEGWRTEIGIVAAIWSAVLMKSVKNDTGLLIATIRKLTRHRPYLIAKYKHIALCCRFLSSSTTVIPHAIGFLG